MPTTSHLTHCQCQGCAISCTPITPQHHLHALAAARVWKAEGHRPRVVLGLQLLQDGRQVSPTLCPQPLHHQLSTLSPFSLTVLQSQQFFRRIRPCPATRAVCPLIHQLPECDIYRRGHFPRLRLGSRQQRVLLGLQCRRGGEPIDLLHTCASCAASYDHALSRVAPAFARVIMSIHH